MAVERDTSADEKTATEWTPEYEAQRAAKDWHAGGNLSLIETLARAAQRGHDVGRALVTSEMEAERASRDEKLRALLAELGDALTPVAAFVEDPQSATSYAVDWRAQTTARVRMTRVRELMAQIRELLR